MDEFTLSTMSTTHHFRLMSTSLWSRVLAALLLLLASMAMEAVQLKLIVLGVILIRYILYSPLNFLNSQSPPLLGLRVPRLV